MQVEWHTQYRVPDGRVLNDEVKHTDGIGDGDVGKAAPLI